MSSSPMPVREPEPEVFVGANGRLHCLPALFARIDASGAQGACGGWVSHPVFGNAALERARERCRRCFPSSCR